MVPVGHSSLQHRITLQAGPSASSAPAPAPSPSQPARPIATIRVELDACGEALAKAYARQGQAGQRSGSRPPVREELLDSDLRLSPDLAFRLCGLRSRKSATVTYRDAQSGLKQYWNLSGTSQEIAQIERQAAQYKSLQEELQASQTSLENLPGELLEMILRQVPATQESKVMSLAQTSRTLRAGTVELARMKAQVVQLQDRLAQLDQIEDQDQRLSQFMAAFNDVMHGQTALQDELRTSMAYALAAGLGALPQGVVSIDVFNPLMELARSIADPMARGEMAQALSVGLWTLPEGERLGKFNNLMELARGIADPVAKGQVTQALAGKFVALPVSTANIDVFNNLVELIPDIADPVTRKEAVRWLAAGLWALPAGAARIDGFNHLVNLARGMADSAARGRLARALADELPALPAGAAHDQARASLQGLALA